MLQISLPSKSVVSSGRKIIDDLLSVLTAGVGVIFRYNHVLKDNSIHNVLKKVTTSIVFYPIGDERILTKEDYMVIETDLDTTDTQHRSDIVTQLMKLYDTDKFVVSMLFNCVYFNNDSHHTNDVYVKTIDRIYPDTNVLNRSMSDIFLSSLLVDLPVGCVNTAEDAVKVLHDHCLHNNKYADIGSMGISFIYNTFFSTSDVYRYVASNSIEAMRRLKHPTFKAYGEYLKSEVYSEVANIDKLIGVLTSNNAPITLKDLFPSVFEEHNGSYRYSGCNYSGDTVLSLDAITRFKDKVVTSETNIPFIVLLCFTNEASPKRSISESLLDYYLRVNEPSKFIHG